MMRRGFGATARRRLGRIGAALSVLATVFAVGAPNEADAQQAACVAYEHANFRGDRLPMSEGETFRELRVWNDRISSIRVAPGCELTATEDRRFRGRRASFREDAPYVGGAFNDVFSALECSCQNAVWRRQATQQPRQPASGAACVAYDRRDFAGDRLEMDAGQVFQRLRNWNDRISSIRVRNGCALEYAEHWNFGGDRGSVTSDVRFVGTRMNNKMSALSCSCEAEGGRRNIFLRGDDEPPRPSRDGAACVMFRDSNFGGAWRSFEAGREDRTLGDRLDQQVSSVKVAPGCVALIDINRPYKLWVEQDVRQLSRDANDRADTVTCFCPSGWR